MLRTADLTRQGLVQGLQLRLRLRMATLPGTRTRRNTGSQTINNANEVKKIMTNCGNLAYDNLLPQMMDL